MADFDDKLKYINKKKATSNKPNNYLLKQLHAENKLNKLSKKVEVISTKGLTILQMYYKIT